MKLTKFIDDLKTELKKVQWKKVIILGVLMGVILGTFGHCVSLNTYAAESDDSFGLKKFNTNLTLVSELPLNQELFETISNQTYIVTNTTFTITDGTYTEDATIGRFLPAYLYNGELRIFYYINEWLKWIAVNPNTWTFYSEGYLFPVPNEIEIISFYFREDMTQDYIDTNSESYITWIVNNMTSVSSEPSDPELPAFTIELAGDNLTSNTQLAIRGQTETKTYDGTYFQEGVVTLDSSSFTPDYIGGGEYRYRVGISNIPNDSRVLVYSGYPLTTANLVNSYSILSVASSGVSVNDGYVVYIERGTSSTLTNPEFNITFVPDPDYKAAYDEGFDDGYDYGYSAGLVAGREEGYQSGYEEGKNTSDSAHLGENLLGSTLEVPMNALNSFIIYQNGDVTITLGLVVGAMLALILLIAFLKLFA